MQKKKNAAVQVFFWMMALAWIAVVFLLSRQTAAESGRLSRGLTEFVLRIFPRAGLEAAALENLLRNLAHGAIFVVEGFLLAVAAAKTFGAKAGAAISIAASALLAVGSELMQTMAKGRSCELWDMGIDFAGALFGIAAALGLMLFIHKLSRPCVTKHQ